MAVKKKAKRKSTTAKRKPAAKSKATRKASARKKPASRKASSKRAKPKAKAAAPKAIPSIRKKLTKTEMTKMIANATDLSNKQVQSVLECFKDVIEKSIKGNGQFVMPGVLKVTVKKVKAKKARKGINPFTGEEMMFKAKPAHKKVKISALKGLKEAAN